MFRFILPLSLLALSTPSFAEQDTRQAFSRPQQLVDIGGRRLNLYCSGTGPVTVVFDAPSGSAGWSWFEVQPQVAKRTRACVYDRAGLGFSDPSPRPGTSGNAVDDLHKLLGAAGIAPPYLMVGNSYGGGNVQLYAYRYPAEVKGLVLVEPQHEDETIRLNKVSGGKLQGIYDQLGERDNACVAQSEKGFDPGSEMWNTCIGTIPPNRGRVLGAAQLAVHRSASYWRAQHSENVGFNVGNAELRAARAPFGDLPVIVLSRGLSQYATPGKPESALSKATEAENKAIHKEIAALSSRGSHRIVPGAHHVIHEEQPQAVVNVIGELLDKVGQH
ncbi:MAG: alpha/beta hydrolase [Pseudomonadota bacterium]